MASAAAKDLCRATSGKKFLGFLHFESRVAELQMPHIAKNQSQAVATISQQWRANLR